jgi:UDP:flavonoid glycosyltransferase YjiC (YdhE family)
VANILCVTNGPAGSLYSCLELARRLAEAGHRLTFAGLANARASAKDLGIGFLELEESRYQAFLDSDATSGVLHRLFNLQSRRHRAKKSMAVDGFAQEVADLDPDLVLIDGEMHEHIITIMGTGAPIALVNAFASIWKRPGLPPPHCLVQPGVGWKGSRVGTSLLWLALRFRKWRAAWSHRLRRVGCDRQSIVSLLARDAGIDLSKETDAGQWLVPFTYRRVPVLSLHALEFEFPHEPPATVHFVGPMVLEPRIDRPLAAEDRAKLDGIVERRLAGNDRRLIYAGFGSFVTTDVAFLRRLIGVVRERPEWELVISLGDRISPADLGDVPERVHALPWIPQTTVLARSDVVVTHGGINTIDECVLNEVPMLVYCGWETDMAGNTARVAYHGIGIAGDRQRDDTVEIRGHIDRLLRERRFENNLRHMRSLYQAYIDDRVAERTVENLLQTMTGRSDRRDEGGTLA